MTELQSKFVTCRKRHGCEWCGTAIDKGEKAHYRSFVWDDRLQSGWAHLDCWDAMLKTSGYVPPWFEWTPGDFKRGEVGYE